MEKNPWRGDFPQMETDAVFIDNAASSLKPRTVIDAVDRYYRDLSANVHRGVYFQSYEATRLYEETRKKSPLSFTRNPMRSSTPAEPPQL
jgi:cysteine desulfurase/selenocysteine lyase